jgi:hypothetical protein
MSKSWLPSLRKFLPIQRRTLVLHLHSIVPPAQFAALSLKIAYEEFSWKHRMNTPPLSFLLPRKHFNWAHLSRTFSHLDHISLTFKTVWSGVPASTFHPAGIGRAQPRLSFTPRIPWSSSLQTPTISKSVHPLFGPCG